MMHIVDWYTTFCALNGINPSDPNAKVYNLPNVDGFNIWPLIMGKNETSPRTEIPINPTTLIQNDYKLLLASSIEYAGWTGPTFPNSSSPQHDLKKVVANCQHGCLYNLTQDYTEHVDISSSNQDIVNSMRERLKELKSGFYSNNETGIDSCPKNVNEPCACWMAANKYNGYIGPFQYLDD